MESRGSRHWSGRLDPWSGISGDQGRIAAPGWENGEDHPLTSLGVEGAGRGVDKP